MPLMNWVLSKLPGAECSLYYFVYHITVLRDMVEAGREVVGVVASAQAFISQVRRPINVVQGLTAPPSPGPSEPEAEDLYDATFSPEGAVHIMGSPARTVSGAGILTENSAAAGAMAVRLGDSENLASF